MVERNAGLPSERRIEFRIGVHLGDVVLDHVGDLGGERLDDDLAQRLFENAALADADGVFGADQLDHHRGLNWLIQPDAHEIDVNRLAVDRVTGQLLEHDRRARATLQLEVQHGAGMGQSVAQLPRVDRESDRFLAASIDHAGHFALAAQPPGRPGAGGLAGLCLQGGCVRISHGEVRW